MKNEPFVWDGTELSTIGMVLDAMVSISEHFGPETAARFMREYRAVNEFADQNAGYLIGYIEPAATRERMYDLFQVQHPLFTTKENA